MTAFFPTFIPYFLSALGLALTFQIAWRIAVFAQPNFGPRAIFTYTLTILTGIGLYLFTAHLAYWWLTLLILLFLAGMYLLVTKRLQGKKTGHALRSLFSFYQITWLVSAALLIFGLPFLASIYDQFKVNQQSFSATASSASQEIYFSQDLSIMVSLVNTTAQSPNFRLNMEDSTQSRKNALNDLTAANRLSFAIFLSPDGTTVFRTNHPEKNGDNLFSSLPWLNTARQDTTASGLILNEEGQPSLIAAVEIRKNEQILGYLLAGKYIDQDYITNSSKGGEYPALALDDGILNSTNPDPTIQSILSSISFNTWLSSATSNTPVVFSFDKQLFSATFDSIPLKNSVQALRLVFVKKAPSNWFTTSNPWYAF